MLVLSRRLNERIVFPCINAAIEIVALKQGVVRLGIEAPPEVTILREELQQRATACAPSQTLSSAIDHQGQLRELNHQLRNKLNGASIGLALLNRQLQGGLIQDAQATLAAINGEFQLIEKQLNAADATQSKAAPVQNKSRALLVEDNANERELLAMFLRMAGVDVDTAGDGADALDYLRSHARPDVVLLDMGLPRCDGPTMVREVRRDPSQEGLRIFAVSGRSADEFDLSAGPSGVDRWFRKPLDPLALVHDLNQELTRSADRRTGIATSGLPK